jgi:tetratricopeptide (TPR) repeat protein
MRQLWASQNVIERVWGCPQCGPTLDESRRRCSRCAGELTFIQDVVRSTRAAGPAAVDHRRKTLSRTRFWLAVAASAVLVLATVGRLQPQNRVARGPEVQEREAPSQASNDASTARGWRASFQASAAPIDPSAKGGESYRPGDLGHALDHYRAALADRPADPELLDNVGQILVAMNRPAEAVPFLKQAVEAEPSNMTARFDLAVSQTRSGQLNEAVDEYTLLVQSGTADVRVHHNLGLALRQLGRQAEAAAAFERATELAPNEAPAWLGLALSIEANGRPGDAAAALDRYLALEPNGADADNVRARIARLRPVVQVPPTEPGGAISSRCP